MSGFIDLTGERFGKLVVIQQQPRKRDENGRLLRIEWLCQCDCGNTCVTSGANLRSGKISCGCAVVELREKGQYKHLEKARAAAVEARRLKREGIEKQPRCPFPDHGCTKSKRGVCCWDCDKYVECEALGKACKNSPAKCGVLRHEG